MSTLSILAAMIASLLIGFALGYWKELTLARGGLVDIHLEIAWGAIQQADRRILNIGQSVFVNRDVDRAISDAQLAMRMLNEFIESLPNTQGNAPLERL